MFDHISPDPNSTDDLVPITPYWQIEDILLGARYILRRRNGDEVLERAGIIQAKLFNDDDDFVMLPNRALPFRPPARSDQAKLPLTIEQGWLEAEDFAVLALLKVDEAIDALQDGTLEDLVVVGGVLLDAYQCLLQAERAKGQYILTPDEFVEFRSKYLEAKKERISEQNSNAPKQRRFEKVKMAVLEIFQQMREDRPGIDRKVLAKEIADMYMKTVYPDEAMELSCTEYAIFKQLEWKLHPTNAARTIKGWIKEYALNPPPAESKKESLQSLRK